MTILRQAIINGIFGGIIAFGIVHYIVPINPAFGIIVFIAFFGTIMNCLTV